MIYNFCIKTTNEILIGYNVIGSGFMTMFLFGFTQSLIEDLFNYFSYDYRNLINNPSSMMIKDIMNFSSICGFIIGSALNINCIEYYRRILIT